nr:MAG TPA_asm: hypothetical protein [Caudoviricetes sp.]
MLVCGNLLFIVKHLSLRRHTLSALCYIVKFSAMRHIRCSDETVSS